MKVNGINSRWREIVVAAVAVAIVVTVVVAVVVAAVVVVVAAVVGVDVFLQTENGKVMILLRLAANRDKMVFCVLGSVSSARKQSSGDPV